MVFDIHAFLALRTLISHTPGFRMAFHKKVYSTNVIARNGVTKQSFVLQKLKIASLSFAITIKICNVLMKRFTNQWDIYDAYKGNN